MTRPTQVPAPAPAYHPDSDAAVRDAATRALLAEACRTGTIAVVLYPSGFASLDSQRWGTHPVTLHQPGTPAPGEVHRG